MKRDILTTLSVLLIVLLFPLSGCIDEANDGTMDIETDVGDDVPSQNNQTNSTNSPIIELTGTGLEFVNPELVEKDGLVLIAANGGNKIQLMNKTGHSLHTWNLQHMLGNDYQLLPNGDILAIVKINKTNNPALAHGGFGGSVQIIGPDGEIKWRFDDLINETMLPHHDVELLPNGNILVMVWEELNQSDAANLGIDCISDLAYESIYEVNVTSNNIVWKWRSIDHYIQDRHPDLPNFGNITSNAHRIDFNLNTDHPRLSTTGDIMHANGIDYDEENDLIYLSVNFYSEVWVIDHSTTIEQASNHTGGNYGKGGDLVYRFGNSAAYQSNESIIFTKNHFPNLIENPDILGYGNILVFSNGNNNISTVFELSLPVSNYPTLTPPEIVWNYSNEDLFAGKLSGADRGRNNNTYIAEGDYGVWEVTPEGDIAWKYNHGPTWRAYVHYHDEPGVQAILQNP